MNQEELIDLIKEHREIKSEQISALKDLVENYPYFTIARLLYLRALQQKKSLSFDTQLNKTFLYATDRAWLYYFLYPEKKALLEYAKPQTSKESSGGYFDLLEVAAKDAEDVNDSLKVLAERLKQARIYSLKSADRKQTDDQKQSDAELDEHKSVKEENFEKPLHSEQEGLITAENYQEKIKLLIQNRQYNEALEILNELYLNNPKKNVYFADQIRFVQKIIANS